MSKKVTTIDERRLKTPIILATEEKRKQAKRREQNVVVVGLGYVGLPLALLAEKKGFTVGGLDINLGKINALKNGLAPELNADEQSLLKKSKIKFSHSDRIIKDADVVIVCVPTPVHKDHTPDLKPLREAATAVGKNLQPGTLVLVESTVNPGVCQETVIPILEKNSGLKVEEDFFFAHCPERINPGDKNFTVATIPRVIGADSEASRRKAASFYRSILDADVVSNLEIREAESVKMVENAFRDINIAFVNELAMSFDRLGIDVLHVIDAASTKPFGFMTHLPGCGVGGHCIPVDPYYLIDYAKKNGFSHRFIKTAREINNQMPFYTINRLKGILRDKDKKLSEANVALLGLAYKRDISDCRESPALVIAEKLRAAGTKVIPFDPFYTEENTYLTLEDTLSAADYVIVATDHTLFREITPEILKHYNIEAVIDGRNCLSKDDFVKAGIIYRGIGR